METVGVILCAVIMALSSTEVVQTSAGTLWQAFRTGAGLTRCPDGTSAPTHGCFGHNGLFAEAFGNKCFGFSAAQKLLPKSFLLSSFPGSFRSVINIRTKEFLLSIHIVHAWRELDPGTRLSACRVSEDY